MYVANQYKADTKNNVGAYLTGANNTVLNLIPFSPSPFSYLLVLLKGGRREVINDSPSCGQFTITFANYPSGLDHGASLRRLPL
ncbi:hypothetical protein E2C01_043208 [Portunus trituberculatus]|uniref:Uncharacterized protein n=1 Tax=Portunus trituberculatus TaxID=210409 RepID=A0A5B7FVP7_PORTR|nr:hypothetical protein [Portunus trituberculatus]